METEGSLLCEFDLRSLSMSEFWTRLVWRSKSVSIGVRLM